ncbi:hypothetical protein [Flavihumibacter solisilvae]|uniref:hypothetical protein n=1 Tax=Flavihumibacter solisilvae TaxID=1349421 RepID=UPI00126A379B|nr:hypothetical protein [Flavihumibacter solisilvae]
MSILFFFFLSASIQIRHSSTGLSWFVERLLDLWLVVFSFLRHFLSKSVINLQLLLGVRYIVILIDDIIFAIPVTRTRIKILLLI